MRKIFNLHQYVKITGNLMKNGWVDTGIFSSPGGKLASQTFFRNKDKVINVTIFPDCTYKFQVRRPAN